MERWRRNPLSTPVKRKETVQVAEMNSATLVPMNKDQLNPEDEKLGRLLRESRTAPPLPPRFQDNVWRRIEGAKSPRALKSPAWLEVLAVWVLRPRLALAGVTALILAGAFLGARDGTQLARRDAQAHYLAAVAPNSLR
jgi:hypothetical protein